MKWDIGSIFYRAIEAADRAAGKRTHDARKIGKNPLLGAPYGSEQASWSHPVPIHERDYEH